MLSTDVFTQFRGRGDEIYVSPLSFFEVQNLFENKKQALDHYMLYSGLPEVYNLQLDKKNWISKRFIWKNLY